MTGKSAPDHLRGHGQFLPQEWWKHETTDGNGRNEGAMATPTMPRRGARNRLRPQLANASVSSTLAGIPSTSIA